MKNKYRKYTQKINSCMTYGDKVRIIQMPFTKMSFREKSKLEFEAKRIMHQRRDKRHSYTKKIRRDERIWKREVLKHFKVKTSKYYGVKE